MTIIAFIDSTSHVVVKEEVWSSEFRIKVNDYVSLGCAHLYRVQMILPSPGTYVSDLSSFDVAVYVIADNTLADLFTKDDQDTL